MQSMFLFGGNDLSEWRDTMDVFSPASKRWTVAGEMPSQRGSAAATALPGHVYLVGGGMGPNWNNDCMRFDIASNEWYQVTLREACKPASQQGGSGNVGMFEVLQPC